MEVDPQKKWCCLKVEDDETEGQPNQMPNLSDIDIDMSFLDAFGEGTFWNLHIGYYTNTCFLVHFTGYFLKKFI